MTFAPSRSEVTNGVRISTLNGGSWCISVFACMEFSIRFNKWLTLVMSLNLLKSNWLFYQSNLYGLGIDQKGSAMTPHVVKRWSHQLKSRLHDNKQRYRANKLRGGRQGSFEVLQDLQVQSKGIIEGINFKYTACCLQT